MREGNVGQQVQGPGTPGFAEPARGLVANALERVGLGLVADGLCVLGAALLLAQAVRALLRKGVEGVADGPDGASEPFGDPGGPLPLGAGQQDLRAPQRKRLGAAEAGPELLAPSIGEFSNKERWFHNPLFGPSTSRTRNRLRFH